MTTPTFSPTPGPSPGNSYIDRIPRLLATQFGDGYSQRSVDGNNAIVRVATLQWDTLTTAELETIQAFFDGTSYVTPFWWTPFGDTTAYLWLLDWTNSQPFRITAINPNTVSLRIILRQVFDLAT
jgi:phage-related protein